MDDTVSLTQLVTLDESFLVPQFPHKQMGRNMLNPILFRVEMS